MDGQKQGNHDRVTGKGEVILNGVEFDSKTGSFKIDSFSSSAEFDATDEVVKLDQANGMTLSLKFAEVFFPTLSKMLESLATMLAEQASKPRKETHDLDEGSQEATLPQAKKAN